MKRPVLDVEQYDQIVRGAAEVLFGRPFEALDANEIAAVDQDIRKIVHLTATTPYPAGSPSEARKDLKSAKSALLEAGKRLAKLSPMAQELLRVAKGLDDDPVVADYEALVIDNPVALGIARGLTSATYATRPGGMAGQLARLAALCDQARELVPRKRGGGTHDPEKAFRQRVLVRLCRTVFNRYRPGQANRGWSTPDKPIRVFISLVYEAATGEPDASLERAVRAILTPPRQP